jgi:tetratricopeptide (TPR) repeat protein
VRSACAQPTTSWRPAGAPWPGGTSTQPRAFSGERRRFYPLRHARIALLPDLVEAHVHAGELDRAETLATEGIEAAETLADEHLIALARVARAWLTSETDARRGLDRALADAEEAVAVFERAGDDRALARAWDVVRGVHWTGGQLGAAKRAAERGILHADRAGDLRQAGWHRIYRTACGYFGLAPMDDVDEEMKCDLAWARQTGSIWLEALLLWPLGAQQVARGNTAAGKELIERGVAIMSELGMRLFAASTVTGWVWYVTDDPGAAEAHLGESYTALAEAGEKSRSPDVAFMLADALYEQGRYEEAAETASAAAGATGDDVSWQVLELAVAAKLLARRGRREEAESLARQAVAVAFTAEYIDSRAESLLALATVLRLAGRLEEATTAMQNVVAIWEAKGNILFAQRARARLSDGCSASSAQRAL